MCHLCCLIILMALQGWNRDYPILFSCKVMSNSLQPHDLQHVRLQVFFFFFLIDQETKALKCYICPLEYMLMKATVVSVLFTIVFSLCDSRLVQSNCSFALLNFAIEIHSLTWLCCTSFSWTFLSFSLFFFC